MADLVFVSIIVAFFALCVLYLKWCDRIIGPDELGTERDDGSPYDGSASSGSNLGPSRANRAVTRRCRLPTSR